MIDRVALNAHSKLLADLNSAKVEAESANNFKSQFLTNMSHEMRTPLTSIIGFLELVKSPHCREDDKKKYLEIIERSSQQMLSLIGDILDLSKVESGEVSIENTAFSLKDLLMELTLGKSLRAAERGIQFNFKATTLIPDRICSDPLKLRQILSNLLDNAIKFTERGQVDLSVSFVESVLEFWISDTGIGISSEQERILFRAFSQADASITRKSGGTGLGLVLSRALSEALGGSLDFIESKQGKGSTFRIRIRATLPSDAKLINNEEIKLRSDGDGSTYLHKPALVGLKVLLVEDSPDIQLLITQFLINEGANVESAENGAQGIRRALAENFDVVLMDIQMPILDGHEATQKLRQLKYSGPIVALTAHAMKDEYAKCLQSGFTDFLTKPIKRQILTNTLSQFKKQSQGAKNE